MAPGHASRGVRRLPLRVDPALAAGSRQLVRTPMMKRAAAPWYADGLRFECTRCGHCCTGAGWVWVSEERILAIAEFLGLTREAFGRRYLRRVGGRVSLVEKANTDCVFWERDAGCTIYPVRPEQCRSFPFWPEHLESPETWREVAEECPGVGSGRLHPVDEIGRRSRRG